MIRLLTQTTVPEPSNNPGKKLIFWLETMSLAPFWGYSSVFRVILHSLGVVFPIFWGQTPWHWTPWEAQGGGGRQGKKVKVMAALSNDQEEINRRVMITIKY